MTADRVNLCNALKDCRNETKRIRSTKHDP
jgi:hypothetical protein